MGLSWTFSSLLLGAVLLTARSWALGIDAIPRIGRESRGQPRLGDVAGRHHLPSGFGDSFQLRMDKHSPCFCLGVESAGSGGLGVMGTRVGIQSPKSFLVLHSDPYTGHIPFGRHATRAYARRRVRSARAWASGCPTIARRSHRTVTTANRPNTTRYTQLGIHTTRGPSSWPSRTHI